MPQKLPDRKLTANITLLILGLLILFHLLILSGIIPYSIVWGGRITDASEMVTFESISILVNLLIIYFVLVRGGHINFPKPELAQMVMWLICGLFVLNTIGNLLSVSSLERAIFTPLTIVLSILTFRLGLNN